MAIEIADALEVSADALHSDSQITIKDKDLLIKFEGVQDMQGDTKQVVVTFLDMAIRDFKTKQAYSH